MPNSTNPRKLSKSNRRSFLKKIAGLGFLPSTLTALTPEAMAQKSENLNEEVPYVAAWSRIKPDNFEGRTDEHGRYPIYDRMPRDRWNLIKSSENAANNLRRRLGLDFIGTGAKNVTSGQHQKKVVTVEYPIKKTPSGEHIKPDISYETFLSELPDTVEGTVDNQSFEFNVKPEKYCYVNQDYYDYEYDVENPDVNDDGTPAGCFGEFVDCYDNRWQITYGSPAYDSNSSNPSYVMVSAGHNFAGCGDDAHQPKEWYSGSKIGDADGSRTDYQTYFDAAVIDLVSGSEVRYDIAGTQGSYDWTLGGKLSWTQLQNMENNSDSMYVQGSESGRLNGTVTDTKSGTNSWEKVVEVDVNTNDGDSGGPYFDVRTVNGTDYAYIAAIHKCSSCTSNGSARGTAWWAIEDRWPSINL